MGRGEATMRFRVVTRGAGLAPSASMKTKARKLRLARETVHALSPAELQGAAGGYYVAPFLNTFSCRTCDLPQAFITYKCTLVPRACASELPQFCLTFKC